jgi:hypothetical protein
VHLGSLIVLGGHLREGKRDAGADEDLDGLRFSFTEVHGQPLRLGGGEGLFDRPLDVLDGRARQRVVVSAVGDVDAAHGSP